MDQEEHLAQAAVEEGCLLKGGAVITILSTLIIVLAVARSFPRNTRRT